MKIESAIFDTGPLVAVLSAKDSWHGWAVKLFNDLPLPGLDLRSGPVGNIFSLAQ